MVKIFNHHSLIYRTYSLNDSIIFYICFRTKQRSLFCHMKSAIHSFKEIDDTIPLTSETSISLKIQKADFERNFTHHRCLCQISHFFLLSYFRKYGWQNFFFEIVESRSNKNMQSDIFVPQCIQ